MNPGVRPSSAKKSTFHRLYGWMDSLGIHSFSFMNCHQGSGNFDRGAVDISFLHGVVCMHRGPVIALGNDVSKILKSMDIGHFRAPHPSPRNRKFNNPDFERLMLFELLLWMLKNENRNR
jgi:hypothetical protein